jgi:hypothetical protein
MGAHRAAAVLTKRQIALTDRRNRPIDRLGGGILNFMAYAVKRRKPVPFEFVLDALSALQPATHPMFGCLAVYVGPKIVLVLRDKNVPNPDNGVWLATTKEHHESLRADFPHMRSIAALGSGVTGWQVLPASAPDFEEAALHACDLVIAGDPRIGKVPKSKKRKKA